MNTIKKGFISIISFLGIFFILNPALALCGIPDPNEPSTIGGIISIIFGYIFSSVLLFTFPTGLILLIIFLIFYWRSTKRKNIETNKHLEKYINRSFFLMSYGFCIFVLFTWTSFFTQICISRSLESKIAIIYLGGQIIGLIFLLAPTIIFFQAWKSIAKKRNLFVASIIFIVFYILIFLFLLRAIGFFGY